LIFNQLNVLPTDDTLEYLSSVMSGSPIELDLSKYKVEVITTLDALEANPDNIYNATAADVRVWYDSHVERTSLIMTLESSDLQKRALELNQQGVIRQWFDIYTPHLVLRPNMVPMSVHYRRFVRQMANAFCSNTRALQFTSEYITQVDLNAPINYDFNKAMMEQNQFRKAY
jgi:hypothetical protein